MGGWGKKVELNVQNSHPAAQNLRKMLRFLSKIQTKFEQQLIKFIQETKINSDF